VAFSTQGDTLATGGGTVDLWNATTGRLIRTLSNDGAQSVALSPDGETLADIDDGTVGEWNVADGQLIRDLDISSSSEANVTFSPNGTTLAADGGDGTVDLWNATTGQLLRSMEDGSGYVVSVAFNPESAIMAAANNNIAIFNTSYLADPRSQLCSQVGESLTTSEWAQYVSPGPSYRDVCVG
jgi:WD40 repeat protein